MVSKRLLHLAPPAIPSKAQMAIGMKCIGSTLVRHKPAWPIMPAFILFRPINLVYCSWIYLIDGKMHLQSSSRAISYLLKALGPTASAPKACVGGEICCTSLSRFRQFCQFYMFALTCLGTMEATLWTVPLQGGSWRGRQRIT